VAKNYHTGPDLKVTDVQLFHPSLPGADPQCLVIATVQLILLQ